MMSSYILGNSRYFSNKKRNPLYLTDCVYFCRVHGGKYYLSSVLSLSTFSSPSIFIAFESFAIDSK